MRKFTALVITVLAILLTSCGRETITANTTAEIDTSAYYADNVLTAPQGTMPVYPEIQQTEIQDIPTTTQPPQTSTQPSDRRRSVDAFYELLCSDIWVEITSTVNPSPVMYVRFMPDRNMTVYYDSLQAEPYDYALEIDRSDENILYTQDETMSFIDIGRDDMIRYVCEGAGSVESVLIRQSLYDRNNTLATMLRTASYKTWRSTALEDFGLSVVNTDGFDVTPINRTTALVVYREKVQDCMIQAVVTTTERDDALDAFVIITIPNEMEYEDNWSAERWTKAYL